MKTNSIMHRILVILLVIIGMYLVIDHGQHLLPYLPFMFLLGCLAMHLFMRGSHGDNNRDEKTNEHGHH